MQAMLLERIASLAENPYPLRLADWPEPMPEADEVLIRVAVCGVCHTELDEIEGRMPPPQLPMILGHQAVGRVVVAGAGATGIVRDQRVGVAWIHSACGTCAHCLADRENLCPDFRATGRDRHGGYAQYLTAPAAFVHPLPDTIADTEAAPLLCAGAVGYRSLTLTGLRNQQILGLMGFGASAHLVLQMVRRRFPDSPVFVFARSPEEQDFARELGAAWAGTTTDRPPAPCQAIIDTTPAWMPIVAALGHLAPGGRLVINAIRKEANDQDALLRLSYPEHLWLEKEIKSVANVTRADVREFLELAGTLPIRPEVEEYRLADANQALVDLKNRRIRGAKVLRVN